jgi:adenylate cyclase
LPLLQTRIGISTGSAFLGNMGTYDKVGFTAIGAAVNLGARPEPTATPGEPCISEETWKIVRERFKFCGPAGRQIGAEVSNPSRFECGM